MGVKRRGRYPAHSVSAFEITCFSRTRRGREKVPGGATGGPKEPRNEPSLFSASIFVVNETFRRSRTGSTNHSGPSDLRRLRLRRRRAESRGDVQMYNVHTYRNGKLNRVDPRAWLAHVLGRLPGPLQSASTNCCRRNGRKSSHSAPPRRRLQALQPAATAVRIRWVPQSDRPQFRPNFRSFLDVRG
jgi:hypothetical protein